MMPNPLLTDIETVRQRIEVLKTRVRELYFDVLMGLHPCPECGSKMHMTGPSQCACVCGISLDPTVAFQRSRCCGAALVKRRCHYACSSCGAVEPSKFLFDERLFEPDYFRQRMRLRRQERKRKREALKRLLADSHTDTWFPENPVGFDLAPALCQDLDEHIAGIEQRPLQWVNHHDVFRMAPYRQVILEQIDDCYVWFNGIPAVRENPRLDRVRRFITLIFMENDREVHLEQQEEDILVKPYEAYD